MVCLSWLLCDRPLDTETERTIDVFFHLISTIILSPLRRMLLEYGYGDIFIEVNFHLLQPLLSILVMNVSRDDISKVELVVTRTLILFAEKGFDTDAVEASMNTMEFICGEHNKKILPEGLFLMLQSIDKWIYGMDPFDPLKHGNFLMELNARIKKEGSKAVFSPLIKKFILNNPHKVVVAMQPDPQKFSGDKKAEEEILGKVKAGVTENDLAELVHATRELQLKQINPDPPEALRSVPSLSLQDIPKPIHVVCLNGVKVLQHDFFTNDVLSVDIVFRMGSLKQELLPLVPIFWQFVIGEPGYKDMTLAELHQLIARKTGGISVNPVTSSVR
ncbi:hypothetical protein ACFX2G_035288 [Malus domestica]